MTEASSTILFEEKMKRADARGSARPGGGVLERKCAPRFGSLGTCATVLSVYISTRGTLHNTNASLFSSRTAGEH